MRAGWALLRRRELDRAARGGPVQTVGGIRIDFARHRVEVDGRPAGLTPSEFKLLAFLAEQPDRVLTRTQIMEHLWETQYVGDPRACDVHISNLRQKVERDPQNPELILTVRRVGYRFAEDAV